MVPLTNEEVLIAGMVLLFAILTGGTVFLNWKSRRTKEILTIEKVLERLEKQGSVLGLVDSNTKPSNGEQRLTNGWVNISFKEESSSIGLVTTITATAGNMSGAVVIKANRKMILSVNNNPPKEKNTTAQKILDIVREVATQKPANVKRQRTSYA